jgi:hypothetical protein
MRIYNERRGDVRDDTNLRWNGDVAIVTARKEHECETCPEMITAGEQYVFTIEKSGGGRYAETERCHYHVDCFQFDGNAYELLSEAADAES